jgi:GT2 family glycosyltransferase
MTPDVYVIIPSWNGRSHIADSITSVLKQTIPVHLIVVDNGSTDGSVAFITKEFPEVELIQHSTNRGFSGGINPGFKAAIERDIPYVISFNNDAVADPAWAEHLKRTLDEHGSYGMATCKFVSEHDTFDSTGECYTHWGLPYPRGRGEPVSSTYDNQTEILAATGGATMMRTAMLKEIGLFDEDFFAYYEDVDLSLRAQLAGWKIRLVPEAIVRHQIGGTGGKIKGFYTYQTMKNYPWILLKDMPASLYFRILPRFILAYALFFVSAVSRRQGWYALRGLAEAIVFTPKKFWQRLHIQRNRKVSPKYIWTKMVHDLPPDAHKLRTLRSRYWRLVGRKEV